MRRWFALTAVVASLDPASAPGQTIVEEFRGTSGKDAIYFHVRLRDPSDLMLPELGERAALSQARLPRLVSIDGHAALSMLPIRDAGFRIAPLDFVGRLNPNARQFQFRLIYPRSGRTTPHGDRFESASWIEQPVILKLDDIRWINANQNIETRRTIHRDDLVGLWGAAQIAQLQQFQQQAPDSELVAFAQAAIARERGFSLPAMPAAGQDVETGYRRLFDLFTGGTSLSESLALKRVLRPDTSAAESRTIPVERIIGIDIPEHPWKAMMADRRPEPEPMAELVPRDNYYVCFQSPSGIKRLGDLLDLWGNNLLHAFEYRTRDYRLRDRYEQQLGITINGLVDQVPRDPIYGIALTGSDPYLREGSDLALIVHTDDPSQFTSAHDRWISELRQRWGSRMMEKRMTLKGHAVVHWETRHREVCVYRVRLGKFVICANSEPGLVRLLQVHEGTRASLASSLDFQYMRTCFVRGRDEHGFAFLSDAFLRKMAGPTMRIAHARRGEAIATLRAMTHTMLVAALDRGKLLDDFELSQCRYLPANAREMPEGKPAYWDDEQKVAASDTYNTLAFATPLIELPITKVTPSEAAHYESFRRDYGRLWGQFFDPVGIRFRNSPGNIRMEMYILPLTNNTDYRWLRTLTGGPTISFDPSEVPGKSFIQFTSASGWDNHSGRFFVRSADSPSLRELARTWIKLESEGQSRLSPPAIRVMAKLPWLIGIEGGLVPQVKQLLPLVEQFIQGIEKLTEEYRGCKIVGYRFPADHPTLRMMLNLDDTPGFQPTIYVLEHRERLYLSLRLDVMKELIDQENKATAKDSREPIHAAVLVNPKNAPHARAAFSEFFEWRTHSAALRNHADWYLVHRAGLIPSQSSEATARQMAMKYLGFVPIAPDGTTYSYNAAWDEVSNTRHGSWRQALRWPALADPSPLRTIFENYGQLQLRLRFREDGLHASVDWEQ
jgi:hypothetical protein